MIKSLISAVLFSAFFNVAAFDFDSFTTDFDGTTDGYEIGAPDLAGDGIQNIFQDADSTLQQGLPVNAPDAGFLDGVADGEDRDPNSW